jgi:TolB-like protein
VQNWHWQVKNIARPVDVYRVSLDVEAIAQAVPRPEQRPTRLAKRRWRPPHARVAVALALGVGFGAWTAYRAFLRSALVAPYSAQDRRITFAVLPFQAPAEDKEGAKVAAAMTEAALAVEEAKVVWAQVAPPRSVEQALTRHTGTKDLAAALNVHFLLRGNVMRVAAGYPAGATGVDWRRWRLGVRLPARLRLPASTARGRD